MKSFTWRAVAYGLVILLGLLSALPNTLPDSLSRALPGWYTHNTFTLGLDLRGGSHLLLEVDTRHLILEENQAFAERAATSLREARLRCPEPSVSAEALLYQCRDDNEAERVAAVLRELNRAVDQAPVAYEVSRKGRQVRLNVEAAFAAYLKRDAVERSLEVVRRRLNESGLVEPSITRQGEQGILVQLPGVDDPQQIRKLLGTTAKMNLHWVAENSAHHDLRVWRVPGEVEGQLYPLERRVALQGEHIRDAQLGFHPETHEPVVNFALDKVGARQFADMTKANIGRALAVVLDSRVITAPVIRSVIDGGRGEISGAFTAAEASQLALLLRAGALPAPLEVMEERSVGPDLGSDAIAMGLSTGLLGALLVVLFMVGVYGRWGVISCIALAINVGLIFGVLSLFSATLTLPGIAGIILSIGLAVDANILINERIREETRNGKSAVMAMEEGFDRAYGTILDSNATTLLAVSLLFLFGSGPVRGFAIAMAIGLLTSMFTAISVTRLIMGWQVRRLGRQSLRIPGFALLDRLHTKPLNVMRGRHAGLIVSLVLSLASVGLFVAPGLNYGVDFSGGTVVEVQAPGLSVERLRSSVSDEGFAHAAIQEFGGEDNYLIRLPPSEGGAAINAPQLDALKDTIKREAPEATFPRVDVVGPKVSGDFGEATILAIVLAGGAMLGYLWLRFEAHFAIAATLTLALDLTKTVGFFALTGLEFNLTAVAALLALIGYSVNDKVVVFDRIRENLRLTPDKPLLNIMNESITSTLTRTLFTSLTTLLALIPMGIAGGNAVASFALPMIFGVVIGTSSSIFIAAPIVYLIGRRRELKGLAQLRPDAEALRKELELLP